MFKFTVVFEHFKFCCPQQQQMDFKCFLYKLVYESMHGMEKVERSFSSSPITAELEGTQ